MAGQSRPLVPSLGVEVSARKAGFANTLYNGIHAALKPVVPTWSRPQVRNLAHLVTAILARHSLLITELAREYPSEAGEGPHDLRYRVKRIWRFLNNPLLDTSRLMDGLYHLSLPVCTAPGDLLPVLFDTTFLEPFALLTASVPAGGRALPIRWVTYHRQKLEVVFPQDGKGKDVVERALSENLIERRLVKQVWKRIATGIRAVLVADRGFAGADFFAWMQEHQRHFVVRFQSKTHVSLPEGQGGKVTGAAKEVVAIKAGEKRWFRGIEYRKDGAVTVNLLVILDEGQKEPWFLVTDLEEAQEVEQLYRWRMREEREYKDCKDLLLLGAKGTRLAVQKVASAARLLDGLMFLHWFVALVGLQARRDLEPEPADGRAKARSEGEEGTDSAPPPTPDSASVDAAGPAPAPEPPRPDQVTAIPHWLRRFQAWGPISYVKLGLEYLRLPDIGASLNRLIAWIKDKLFPSAPLWTRRQARYRASLSRFG